MHRSRLAGTDRSRGGFTLVELLVAVGVLLILAALTLAAISVASEEDVAEGARSAQSYTEGARDRAIYRKRPVGIRLLLDPNGTKNTPPAPLQPSSVVATSLQYIASPSEKLTGVLVVDSLNTVEGGTKPADDGQVLVPAVAPTADFEQIWDAIRTNRGLISRNFQLPISIVVNTSTGAMEKYVVAWNGNLNPPDGRWMLTRPFTGPRGVAVPYELELLPAVMPNQQIRELPRDSLINLTDSKVPAFWYGATSQRFTAYMDVMFSPRGTAIGSASGSGMIHLHICSPEDRERVVVPPGTYFIGKNAPHVIGNPRNVNPERLVSINPVTGNITVSQIPQFLDADEDDIPDVNTDASTTNDYDPYIYAEFGVTAQ